MAKRKRKLKKTRKKPERSWERYLSVLRLCVGTETGELSSSGCRCCLRPLTTRDWFTGPLFPVCECIYLCMFMGCKYLCTHCKHILTKNECMCLLYVYGLQIFILILKMVKCQLSDTMSWGQSNNRCCRMSQHRITAVRDHPMEFKSSKVSGTFFTPFQWTKVTII